MAWIAFGLLWVVCGAGLDLATHDALTGVPMGVWCGEADPFIDATRQLVDRAKPAVADIEPGDHDAARGGSGRRDLRRYVGGGRHDDSSVSVGPGRTPNCSSCPSAAA